MKRRKVCIVITTRGNYAKMKSLMEFAIADPGLELQVIVGGGAILPKYGKISDVLSHQSIRSNRTIHFLVEGENPVAMAKSAGLAITEFSTAFEDLSPDVVVVVADRFECLPIAMAAAYMNIPVAHVEGGEISGSIDESIRHSITKLAHLHFPATEDAADRIRGLGEDPASVFTIGCSSLDVIARLDLDDLGGFEELQVQSGVGVTVSPHEPYLVVIQHPVTTEYDQNLAHIQETISAIRRLNMGVFWIWPNMDAGSDGISKGIRLFREKERPDYVHFFKSLPIELYAPLLKNAACVVGNSSSGIREAAFLGTPSVNVGTRQRGRERGRNVLDVPYDSERIEEGVRRQIAHGRYEPDHLYGDGNAGAKMGEVIKLFEFNLDKRMTY